MLKKLMISSVIFIIICLIIIVWLIISVVKSYNKNTEEAITMIKPTHAVPIITKAQGVTRVNGHVIVNKRYSLPPNYKPKENKHARHQLDKLLENAQKDNMDLNYVSGYRSYNEQKKVVAAYEKKDGKMTAEQYTAKPGHSEHQTGLAFDVGTHRPMKDFHKDFQNSKEAHWLERHVAEYGFIIRYPKGQSKQTGYAYEAWHIRYVGKTLAKIITDEHTNLEHYYEIQPK
ncbi:M15 family metallopeptidase [Staphylococcus gallinarum]|uniref:M15 family metallopeptidase n=1 Tax=Staphylococcus gallinarum TaxID=1293 RepID=UPI001E3771C2|nr:M15 family metallopeptidase [Staphylococcus gallinarum]MCD8830035.1 M15 family metallopeptidase [Staphylococcus gallinarum]MEB6056437.1 M15 family metallopeptidase [Staphylococcus gallinarum]